MSTRASSLRFPLGLVAIALAIAAGPVRADTLFVPEQYPTIGDALDKLQEAPHK